MTNNLFNGVSFDTIASDMGLTADELHARMIAFCGGCDAYDNADLAAFMEEYFPEVLKEYEEDAEYFEQDEAEEDAEDAEVTFGIPTFECLEDNAGGIHLFVMDDEGQPRVVFSGFEYQPAGSLLSALKELQEDRQAWTCWDNAETEDVEEFYVRLTEYSDPIATLDDHGYIDIYESECYIDSRKQLGVPEGLGHVVVGSHDWGLIQSGKMIAIMAVEAARSVGRAEAEKQINKGTVVAYTDLEEHAESYAAEWFPDDEEEKAVFLGMVRNADPVNNWYREEVDGKVIWIEALL